MSLKPRLLIVEDDLRLRTLLERFMVEHGFAVTGAGNGGGLDKALAQHQIDLVVLDLMLPDEDGLTICQRLRGQGNDVPIIMLTAKGDDIDRIVGLELGADDYLAKPCNPRELVARIKAVLRRRQLPVAGAPQRRVDARRVRFGPWTLDTATRQLSRDGQPVPITTGEFAVLQVLVAHPNQPLSRDKLMTLARGREHQAYERSIDLQISRLRRRLEADPGQPRFIQTVWGVGYVFVTDTQTDQPETAR